MRRVTQLDRPWAAIQTVSLASMAMFKADVRLTEVAPTRVDRLTIADRVPVSGSYWR